MRRFAGLTLIVSILMPMLELGVAAWGSMWGWNLDGKLLQEAPTYLLVSYGLFLAPHAVFRVARVSDYVTSGASKLRTKSVPTLLWGIFATGASVVLIHAFSSRALWLGSMGSLYLGLIIAALAGIRLLM